MRKSVLLVLLSFCLVYAHAQNHSLQSLFIYSFAKYVIWPDSHNQGDFEIIVMGETPLMDHLQEMASKKKVGERSIKITRINSISEIRKCNILFLPASKSSEFNDVLSKVSTQPILIITEEPGLGLKGSDINFILKDGKLAFELNQSAVTKQNLKISNELTRMAILI